MTSPRTDLPRVELSEGHPLFVHVCNGEEIRQWVSLGPDGWQQTDDGGLTPSIHCETCGTHGFWVGGDHPHWQAC